MEEKLIKEALKVRGNEKKLSQILRSITTLSGEAIFWCKENHLKISEENIEEIITAMDRAGSERAEELKEEVM